eukprot:1398581-Prymnesium_polylepis.1
MPDHSIRASRFPHSRPAALLQKPTPLRHVVPSTADGTFRHTLADAARSRRQLPMLATAVVLPQRPVTAVMPVRRHSTPSLFPPAAQQEDNLPRVGSARSASPFPLSSSDATNLAAHAIRHSDSSSGLRRLIISPETERCASVATKARALGFRSLWMNAATFGDSTDCKRDDWLFVRARGA